VLSDLASALGLRVRRLKHAKIDDLLVLLLGQIVNLLKQLHVVFHKGLLLVFVLLGGLHLLLFDVLYFFFLKITFLVDLHAFTAALGR